MPPVPQSCGKMKVADLRAALEERGLPTEGLKPALVARLEESLASETSVADIADEASAVEEINGTTAEVESMPPASAPTPTDAQELSPPAAKGTAEPSDEDDDEDELGAIMRAGSDEVEEDEERVNASAPAPRNRNIDVAEATPDTTEPTLGAPPSTGTSEGVISKLASPPIVETNSSANNDPPQSLQQTASPQASSAANQATQKNSMHDDVGKEAPPNKRSKAQEAPAAFSTKATDAGSRADTNTSTGTASASSPRSARNPKAGSGETIGSTSLRVENFLRPFTAKAAREMVERAGGGTCKLKAGEEGFWMDTIKTTAVATFEDGGAGDNADGNNDSSSGTGGRGRTAAAAALAAVNAIHGTVWPPEHGRVLAAKLSSMVASAMHAGQAQELRLRQEAMLALRNSGAAKGAKTAAAATNSTIKATGAGAASATTGGALERPARGLAASRLGAPPAGAARLGTEKSNSSRGGASTGDQMEHDGSSSSLHGTDSSGRVLKKGRGMHLAQYDALKPQLLLSTSTGSSSKLVTVDDVFLRTEVCVKHMKYTKGSSQFQLASEVPRLIIFSCANNVSFRAFMCLSPSCTLIFLVLNVHFVELDKTDVAKIVLASAHG